MLPSFALSVSDALPPGMLADRVSAVADLASGLKNMRHVCVRDDAMDPGLLSLAAVMAEGSGLGVVLESDSPERLAMAAAALDSPPLLLSPGADQGELIAAAASAGAGVVVSSPDPRELPALAALAEDAGCPEVVIHPVASSMKACLESTVLATRLSGLPVACRAWSGEYALALSSVSFLRGGSLAVLDDLDPQACAVLDALASNLRGLEFRSRGPLWTLKDAG